MRAFIDVRGAWPVLVDGLRAWELQNTARGVTVREAVNELSARGELRADDPLVVKEQLRRGKWER